MTCLLQQKRLHWVPPEAPAKTVITLMNRINVQNVQNLLDREPKDDGNGHTISRSSKSLFQYSYSKKSLKITILTNYPEQDATKYRRWHLTSTEQKFTSKLAWFWSPKFIVTVVVCHPRSIAHRHHDYLVPLFTNLELGKARIILVFRPQ